MCPGEKERGAVSRKITQKREGLFRVEYVGCLEGMFFFAETNREIANKFVNLYKQPSFDEVKAGVGVLTERFGWYLTIKQLAESGIFNRPDLTPLHSAEQANLWEAFTYLSSVAEENAYQNRYSEVLSKKK